MEREILITGIGGQGVQLAAKLLARAAVLEGRDVLMFGFYGGAMRGGNTESTLVIADQPIESPPILARAGSAIAMHHEFWEPIRAKLVPGALVVVNTTLFEGALDPSEQRVVEVPANEIAADVGSPLAASMVMIGAYTGFTRIVGCDSLVSALDETLPPYRRQHAPVNAKALRAGFDFVPQADAPIWEAAP